jgi:hypothetical protein
MAFIEKTKINDFAQVGVVEAKKYRCEKCGWITRDEQEYREHECGADDSNKERQGRQSPQ